MSVLTLEAILERTESSTPWGFRMQGGKDFSSPLSIQRVNPGSVAAKCGLQVGDIILKIGSTSTDILRHKEAQSNILECGNRLDLLLQRGGSGGYDKFNAPQVSVGSFHPVSPSPASFSPSAGVSNSPSQNFNSAPRPFGSSAPPPAPAAPRSYTDGGLSQQTQNLSLSSQPKEPVVSSVPSPTSYQSQSEKYSDRDEPLDPSQHQSKSFKYLRNLMDEGKELNAPLRPQLKSGGYGNGSGGNPPPAPAVQSVKAPSPTPLGPGNRPGTVKAIVSQKYNNPIGLYSSDNVSNTYQGQTKFLIDKEETAGNLPATSKDDFPPPPPPEPSVTTETGQGEYDALGRKRYVPSETFRLVQEDSGLLQKDEEPGPAHSKTFKILQQQLTSGAPGPSHVAAPQLYSNKPAPAPASMAPTYQAPPSQSASAPKPWITAPPPAGVTNATPKPFGSSGAPAKPSGVGATRGKKGDAAMNPAALPTGRIPVCSGCNQPIRGPFVTALGMCWCPDHFVCANAQCGVKLLDIGFVEEGGLLYCEKDYAVHFAPHCDKCGKAVIGECVNALGKSFHKDCFLCTHCNKPIGGNQFHLEEGKFYCENDWSVLFRTMCSGCDFPIEPGDAWVEALGNNFHSECFNCSKCQVNLEGQQFVAKAGKPYCKAHAR